MSQAVISAVNLSKQYEIGERERYLVLRDLLARALRAPVRIFGAKYGGQKKRGQQIWALKDVSFDVREGEVVGVIGRNGAGKSTLLKILARVTRPTEGFAEIRGRMGSLLEVGTGFHAELTGRENVYLSGAILGMKKIEIERKFDEIVAFAEVEKFIDTPLKHYSSGMQLRLAFAVAAHLEPEILLVDEVLAVGDMSFQKKCMGKMSDVAHGGRTIVFVSHQMNQIRRLCERVFWVDAGRICREGASADVVGRYESAMASGEASETLRRGEAGGKGRFVRWEIVEPRNDEGHTLKSLEPVTVRFIVRMNEAIRSAHHGIALYNHERQLMWAWAVEGFDVPAGEHDFCHTFPMLPLRPGNYAWQVSLYGEGEEVDVWECLPEMVIATEIHQHSDDSWNGFLNVPSQFRIADR